MLAALAVRASIEIAAALDPNLFPEISYWARRWMGKFSSEASHTGLKGDRAIKTGKTMSNQYGKASSKSCNSFIVKKRPKFTVAYGKVASWGLTKCRDKN